MARSSTTFDATPEGRERARLAPMRHGAKSPAIVGEDARRVYRSLLRSMPELPKKLRPVLRLLAGVRAQRQLVEAHYERAGIITGKGKLDGSASLYAELCRLELALYREVGITQPSLPAPTDDDLMVRALMQGGQR